jgi:hypothetical protein
MEAGPEELHSAARALASQSTDPTSALRRGVLTRWTSSLLVHGQAKGNRGEEEAGRKSGERQGNGKVDNNDAVDERKAGTQDDGRATVTSTKIYAEDSDARTAAPGAAKSGVEDVTNKSAHEDVSRDLEPAESQPASKVVSSDNGNGFSSAGGAWSMVDQLGGAIAGRVQTLYNPLSSLTKARSFTPRTSAARGDARKDAPASGPKSLAPQWLREMTHLESKKDTEAQDVASRTPSPQPDTSPVVIEVRLLAKF